MIQFIIDVLKFFGWIVLMVFIALILIAGVLTGLYYSVEAYGMLWGSIIVVVGLLLMCAIIIKIDDFPTFRKRD